MSKAVSWRSPIATALLGAQVSDVITLRSPRRDEELEVVAVSYSARDDQERAAGA